MLSGPGTINNRAHRIGHHISLILLHSLFGFPAGQRRPWFPRIGQTILTISAMFPLVTVLCWILCSTVPFDCNPVPNPGVCTFMTGNDGPQCQTSLTDYFNIQDVHEGEGCYTSASVAGADHFNAQMLQTLAKCGHPPTGDCGPEPRNPTTRTSVQKRSYKRACRRMLTHGYAWYHGRIVTSTDFPQHLQQNLQTRPSSNRQSTKNHYQGDRHRLKVLQWNPGGITQGVFQEFKLWLQNQPIDLVVLSETRWSFTSCWTDAQWAYIHSASTEPRSGGVLVMVAKAWTHPDQIGYHEDIPGRLLHIRIHFGKRATDILAAYQYADYRDKQSHEARQKFWNNLDQILHTLPNRNQLICSGDFNCALQQQVPWCGTDGFRWHGQSRRGHQHRDQHRFQQILARHHLVALNTWNEAAGPTFQHETYASRIDYICTRIHACDGQSKNVAHLHDADFLPLNHTHHIPLLGTLRKTHVSYQVMSAKRACTLAQRASCRHAKMQDHPNWQSLTDTVRTAVHTVQNQVVASEDVIRTLHQAVIPDFHALFDAKTEQPPQPDYRLCHDTIRLKWTHHRAVLHLRHCGRHRLVDILQVWQHWSAFKCLQRAQQKQARLAKVQRFQELCMAVQQAANRHDAHGMFKIINHYTPRKPMAKLRLRTQDGQISDQYDTHSQLVAFVQRTWQGPRTLPKYHEWAPGVPFTVDQLRMAVMNLHPNRSVAMPFLPAVIWQGDPECISSFLYNLLQHWWGSYPPFIPQDWKDAWLYFIPKPGKPCNKPENLRPISLMETLGKIVMGLIADQLKLHLESMLCQFPQLGFLPMRGSLDAIRRVSEHCSRIRALISANHRTVARQMLQQPCRVLVGGIQMFLDLTRAFDCADRTLLVDHLQELHTPHALLTIITHWHEGTRYHIVSPHTITAVDVGLGLRQGCKIAPLLWLVYMSKLLHLLVPLTGESWIAECLTLYADDVHVGCQFTSQSELDHHLQCMGFLLDCIERLKLKLSYQKTFVVLASTGSSARRALKGRVKRTHQTMMALIPRGDGSKTELPMRSTVSYLGAIMSYGPFEHQTWLLRKRAGWAAFARLKCWLRHRQLHLAQRLYLWRTCVHAILTYGITATYVNIKVLTDYQLTIYQMLRVIFGNHSYCTRQTHSEVLDLYQHPHPLELLRCLIHNLWQRLQRRQILIDHDDFLHNVEWNHLTDQLQLIQQLQDVAPAIPIDDEGATPQVQYPCAHCGFVTHSIPNLRRHYTVQHRLTTHRTSPLTILDMSLNGRAQCRNCHTEFTSWRRFKIHVERNCCQAELRPTPPAMPSDGITGCRAEMEDYHVIHQPFWQELKHLTQTSQWNLAQTNPAIGEYLTHTCQVCGIWTNRCQELHGHYRLNHPDLVAGIFAKSAQITKLLQSPSPCNLCQKPFKRGHTCTVATQLAVLHLYCMEVLGSTMKCDLCGLMFESTAEMHRHLGAIHDLAIHDWNAARDSLASCDACSHCGHTFSSRDGLRHHIITGRCPSFNPLATNTPLNAAQKWEMLLQTGDFEHGLTAHQRLQLTLHCQLCGEIYSRSNDLSAHLQQSHSALWSRSNELVRFLLQTFTARVGCRCNPCTHDVSKTHICNLLRQAAMIFLTSEVDMLVPWQFPEETIRYNCRHISTATHFQMLVNVLLDRDFSHLWHAPALLKLFRNWCVLCGGWFHAAAMTTHQLHCHHRECQWAAQIKFQVLRCMILELKQDYQCHFCKLIYNCQPMDDSDMPERATLKQLHLASNCPVVQQLTLVLLPIHERDANVGPVGHGASPVVCPVESAVSASESIHQIKRRRTALQKAAAGQHRPQRPGSHTGEGNDGPSSNAGTGGHPARQGHTTAASAGLLRFVRPVQPRQCVDNTDATDVGMEESVGDGGGRSEETQPPHLSLPQSDPGPAATHSQAVTECPGTGLVGCGREGGGDQRRWIMALQTVVSSDQDAHHGAPQARGDEQSPQGPAISDGAAGVQQSDPPLPWGETTTISGAMDLASEHEGTRRLDPLGTLGSVDAMVVGGSIIEDAFTNDEQTSTGPGESSEAPQRQELGEGQIEEDMTGATRDDMRQAMLQLVFENRSNLCYANSSVAAFTWACLSRQTFAESDWGATAADFRFMLSNTDHPFDLDQQQWFTELVSQWQNPHGQADSAEFTSLLLQWVAPASVCCHWQRRWMQCENVLIHDQGSRYQPLTLQLHPVHVTEGITRLTDLFRCWHGELGMQAGLTTAPELLCVHIDRLAHAGAGSVQKLTIPVIFTGQIAVPTFPNAGIECTWNHYRTTAVYAHYGADNAGHYQALLRVTDAAGATERASWLHCDDCRRPQPVLEIPAGFHAGVTCVWLCREDVMDMHRWSPADSTDRSKDSLLQMFAT